MLPCPRTTGFPWPLRGHSGLGNQIARHDPQIGDHAEELHERLEDDDHGRRAPFRPQRQDQRKHDEGVAGSEREDERSSPGSRDSGRVPDGRAQKGRGDKVGCIDARRLYQHRHRIPYRVDLRLRPEGVEFPLEKGDGSVTVNSDDNSNAVGVKAPITSGESSVTITMKLPAGPARLRTTINEEKRGSRGAYFVTVKRIEKP